MRFKFAVIALFAVAGLQAQIPTGYYNAAYNLKGYALRVALHNIIDDHTTLTYSALWDAFTTTDCRSDGKVWDVYSDIPSGTPQYLFTFGEDQCGSYSSEGNCYNREHSVPKSWFNDQYPMYTDLFHLYPTDGYVNNKRGNLPFGETANATWISTNGSKVGPSNVSGYSGVVFEPIDEYKGDFARSYLYMTVRYMDKNLGYETQSMFNGASLKPWALAMLMTWSRQDAVSQKEIDRNNAVYALQHNRNPFIDYPELTDKIYGSDSVNAFNPNEVVNWNNSAAWQIYPNPARTQLSIVPPTTLSEPVTITICDLFGQTVLQESLNRSSSFQLPINTLPTGVYILRITTNSFNMNRKIVINQ